MSQPTHKLRIGALQVTIWRNHGEKGNWYSVIPSRSYKQEDAWKEIRPDVLVKGGTYTREEVVGREIVEAYGGRVAVTSRIDGVSTTQILARFEADRNSDAAGGGPVLSSPGEGGLNSAPSSVPNDSNRNDADQDSIAAATEPNEFPVPLRV